MTCPECSTALVGRFCHRCGWDARLPAGGKGAAAAMPRRPRWQRLTMGSILLVSFVTVLVLLLVPRAGAYAYLNPGQPAPDFTLKTPEGQEVSLSDLKGQAVVLNFWASWCGPCRQEMPDLQAAYERYKEDGLVVVGLNLSESRLTVHRFLADVPVTFPILIDEKNRVEDLYHIIPLPTTYFIDKSGKIVHKREGQMSGDYIDRQVRALLGR
jgi:cytochrome c biogenesis protein CcmG/thiol:disulfide interchange protein DsbE